MNFPSNTKQQKHYVVKHNIMDDNSRLRCISVLYT
jgi:hypothetical protein